MERHEIEEHLVPGVRNSAASSVAMRLAIFIDGHIIRVDQSDLGLMVEYRRDFFQR